jgi:hypothetical protein
MNFKKNNLEDLIHEGNEFNFDNNKQISSDFQYYSKASTNLMSWITKVEDYIRMKYDINSGPVKMLESVDKTKFNGYYKSQFDLELNKVKGAINSCKFLTPNSPNRLSFLKILKNSLFWVIIIPLIGGIYQLGFDNGNARFDNEKIELSKQNLILRDSIQYLNKKIIRIDTNKIQKHK